MVVVSVSCEPLACQGDMSVSGSQGSLLRVLRLLRLNRAARIARVLTAIPELMVLVPTLDSLAFDMNPLSFEASSVLLWCAGLSVLEQL